jgi:hypothetical protein
MTEVNQSCHSERSEESQDSLFRTILRYFAPPLPANRSRNMTKPTQCVTTLNNIFYKKVVVSFIVFFVITGTFAFSEGYPTTRIRYGLSFSGLPKIWFKKFIGLGV